MGTATADTTVEAGEGSGGEGVSNELDPAAEAAWAAEGMCVWGGMWGDDNAKAMQLCCCKEQPTSLLHVHRGRRRPGRRCCGAAVIT